MKVALIGAAGHGAWHRRSIAELEQAGLVELVAMADVAPIAHPPAGVPTFRDHCDLLIAARPDVVVVCTPPHTHLPIGLDVLRSGADLLLEKPPVLDLAEHEALTAAELETGQVCQVGFQALGSAALARLKSAIAAGALGEPTSIAARGAWSRPDGYFSRSAWVGRRSLDGRPVLDGALVNPFAHALMQTLALAGPGPIASTVEVELYRAHDIDVDDTACLRLRFASGVVAVVAVTLAAETFVAGDITVTGTGGAAVLEYPTDKLRLPGQAELVEVPGRTNLLANLIAHRSAGTPLLAPLAATAPFTALLEPIRSAKAVEIPAGYRPRTADHVEIVGVNAAIDAATAGLALFSELPDVAWAARP